MGIQFGTTCNIVKCMQGCTPIPFEYGNCVLTGCFALMRLLMHFSHVSRSSMLFSVNMIFSTLLIHLCRNPYKQLNTHIILFCRSLPYTQAITSVSKQAMRSRFVPLGPYVSISLKRWSPPWVKSKHT